jgi:hypothetical protein
MLHPREWRDVPFATLAEAYSITSSEVPDAAVLDATEHDLALATVH